SASSPAKKRISSRCSLRSMACSASARSSLSSSPPNIAVRRSASILSVLVPRISNLAGRIQALSRLAKAQRNEDQEDHRVADLGNANALEIEPIRRPQQCVEATRQDRHKSYERQSWNLVY